MKSIFSYSVTVIISVIALFAVPSEAHAAPADNFVTTWRTLTPGQSIIIPTSGGGYNYDIDWGDSTSDTGVTGDATHVYATPGVYEITISGTFPRIYFADSGPHPDILSIEQWGTGTWSSMDHAFWGAINMVVNATDIPDLSGLTTTAFMFHGTDSLTAIPNINDWDVSNVTDMHNMFSISEFNSDISAWDVSAVTNMEQMFYSAESFNQDIGSWDVSQVTNMEDLLYNATSFNQDISNWDVSSVTNMNGTLGYAVLFNQDLSSWDVSQVTDMTDMLINTNLSIANYDAILAGWSLLSLQSSVNLDATSVQYCSSHQARAFLISTFGWTINDGGVSAATCTFTETPSLIAPTSSSSHARNTPLAISFLLPEDMLAGSLRLTLTPSSGPATVLFLRDAYSLVTNPFNLPLVGGFAGTSEVLSVTGPTTLAEGTYTITLSYQDSNGNATASTSATNVALTGSAGVLRFHIFTDNNSNGTQDIAEVNGFTGTTLTATQGSTVRTISFNSSGDITTPLAVGTHTLRINVPTGNTLTGGSNNFSITITNGETTNAGSRGITPTTSGGGGSGGSSAGVVFGGGTSTSSDSSSSWTASSSRSSSSNRSASTNTSRSTPIPADTLPAPQPKETACLVVSSPAQFTDTQNSIDINYISSFTFSNNRDHHLIRGYGNQSFGPTNPLTRFELLKIAMTSNCIGGGNSTTYTHTNSYFSDVPKDDSEQSKIIGEAYSRGIITGIGDRFYPNHPVTFAEMVKMLLTSSAYFSQGQPNTLLTLQTVTLPDSTFAQPVEYGRRLGILPTPFSAQNTVNRQQMASLLAKYIQAMRSTIISG